MNGDIVPYVHKETPRRPNRAGRQKWQLPASVIEKIVELDKRRRELVDDDPVLNALLVDVELDVMRSLRIRHPQRFRDADFSIWD